MLPRIGGGWSLRSCPSRPLIKRALLATLFRWDWSLPEQQIMNLKLTNLLVMATTAHKMGCRTSPHDERGPNGTVAYNIRVESSVPGVTIETNRVVAGKTPLA